LSPIRLAIAIASISGASVNNAAAAKTLSNTSFANEMSPRAKLTFALRP
jgi:hypothetical protein